MLPDSISELRIAVVGAGGAGAHFAARWVEAGAHVTLVARGTHGRAIREDGLRLVSPLGDAHVHPHVVESATELTDAHFLLLATKSTQLPNAAREASAIAAPVFAAGVQNGVDAAALIEDAIPHANVLGGTCSVVSLIESPGVIRHVGADPRIIIGPRAADGFDVVQRLADHLTVDALEVRASADIEYDIWNKFLFFAPISGLGSVARLTIGELRADAAWRRLLEDGIREVEAVAAAIGVDVGSDALERTLAFVEHIPAQGTSSMHRDIEAGRPSELPDLSGKVVRLGREFGIPTPVHDRIVDELEARNEA